MARRSARLLRGKTPTYERSRKCIMSSISTCASFVIGLPTCPRREWRRVCGYALVVARRFGYQRNRLPHRPKSVLAAWISTVYPSAKSPRDRQCIVAEGSGSNKNFARDTELPSFPLGPGSVRFYLRKRTLTPTVGMSALCQKRTSV
jgi:hypothetical protein